jgi:hypothetical protein
MKSPIILLLALLTFSCSSRSSELQVASRQDVAQKVEAEPQKESVKGRTTFSVSLRDADNSEATTAATDRKIVRNADLTMEVASTNEAQHRVSSIAEAHGGFVVNSESKQRESADPAQRTIDFKVMVRIPADQYGVALDEIKKLASNVLEEKSTGQDVTEEFIDLEARIKTQKALETQFLEIMQRANKIEDALEVQRQIAEVRTEIEKLEGRKRFLENRSSLATITVNIQAPRPIIATTPTGFGHSVREAISDSIELGSGLFLFFVRALILMVPLLIFVVLPFALLIRYAVRRVRRIRLAHALATPAAQ